MKQAAPPAIAPEMRAQLVGIVKDQLSLIEGLCFNQKDVEYIANRLIAFRLLRHTSVSALPRAFRTTGIANKINGLADAWRPHEATLQEIFSIMRTQPRLLTHTTKNLADKIDTLSASWQPAGITAKNVYSFFCQQANSLTKNANTLQDKAETIAALLLAGDLPASPRTGQPQSLSKALKIILGNTTYTSLVNKSMEEIHAVALLTRLENSTLSEATVQTNTIKRSGQITHYLKTISDKKWGEVKHLADKAGFKRPGPLAPDEAARRKAMFAALAAKKAQNG